MSGQIGAINDGTQAATSIQKMVLPLKVNQTLVPTQKVNLQVQKCTEDATSDAAADAV